MMVSHENALSILLVGSRSIRASVEQIAATKIYMIFCYG